MRLLRPSLVTILLLQFGVSVCLYDDQVGKFDWRLQFIGRVTHVSLESPSVRDPQRIYVASEQNVLAAVASATGEIVWRQVFESGDGGRIDALLVGTGAELYTVIGGGQLLQSWDRDRGILRWSAALGTEVQQNIKIIETKTGIYVLFGDEIHAFGHSGSTLWKESLGKSGDNSEWVDLVKGADESEIFVLGREAQKTLTILCISGSRGETIKRHTRQAAFVKESVALVSKPARLVWVDSTSARLHILTLTADDLETKATESVQISGTEGTSLLRLKVYNGHYAVTDLKTKIWIESKAAGTRQLQALDGSVVGFVNGPDGVAYFALATVSARGGFFIRFYNTESGSSVASWDIAVPASEILPSPEQLFPFFSAKFAASDRSDAPSVYATGNDHSLALVTSAGKIVWNRQEALASIMSVEMLDLPLSESQANIEKEFSTRGSILSTFILRITSQAVQVQRLLLNAVNDIFGLADIIGQSESLVAPFFNNRNNNLKLERERNERLERDYFNLHKMIVVATSSGKLFGLDNRRGRILWQKFVPSIRPFTQLSRTVLPLFTLRTTSHYPHPAHCVVVAKNKVDDSGVLVVFNPITGGDFKFIQLSSSIKMASVLPYVDENELQGLVLISDDKKAFVYPPSLSTALSAGLKEKPYFIFLAESGTDLHGYHIDSKIKEDGNFLIYSLTPGWKLQLPLDKGGKLVKVVLKRPSEHVHSQGRVLGDRNVLYKYLNPNLAAALAESVDSTGKTQLNMYLFDVVTGDVLFNAIHRRVNGPYHLVHCENWIVYTYWNEKARRNEVAVLELYEGKDQADPSKFSSLRPPPPPFVARQAYVFPQGISALVVTDTEKGITSRHLLLAMPFGGVLELSKAFLDPRRVLSPTMEQREEGLFPYIPDLPIVTEQIINYNQTLLNIRDIHAAPSGLESTSLVLVYGLDIYFTRVTPSGTFDILKDDFDHLFIASVLLALFLASAVAKKLAKRRDLKMAWK